jgi:hypothetical protein
VGILLLELALAPMLVVGRPGRPSLGPRASGTLIALPLVAGPILLVIALEQGEEFGARAARGALLGIVALSAFCVVFARAGSRWTLALLVGWLAYAVVAAVESCWDRPWRASPSRSPPSRPLACSSGRTTSQATRRGRRRGRTCTRARRRPPSWSSRSPRPPTPSARP